MMCTVWMMTVLVRGEWHDVWSGSCCFTLFQVAKRSLKWHDADAREEEAHCKYVNKHRRNIDE